MPTLQLIPNRCHVPVIQLRIQGTDYYFLVDTGASFSVVHPVLKSILQHGTHTTQTRHMTHNGHIIAERINCKFAFAGILLSSIDIKDTSYLKTILLFDTVGIIGCDILEQFSSAVFDYKRQVVVFNP